MGSSKGLKAKIKQEKKASLTPAPIHQWVVVQLTALGEREKNIQLIIRAVHQLLRRNDLDVFVPAINQKGLDDSLTTWFSEGYVFVRYEPGVSYQKLAETNYFSTVLSTMNSSNGEKKRIYSLLSDKELAHMRNGMQDLKVAASRFKEDEKVKITKGSYKGLPGRVALIYENGEKIQVFVHLRSIKGGGLFMDFPASYLQKDDS